MKHRERKIRKIEISDKDRLYSDINSKERENNI